MTDDFLTPLVFDAMLAFIPAYMAHLKGHAFRRWWVYSFFALPIAFVHAICARAVPSRS